MSTGKMNVTYNRFAYLARMGEIVFHAADLANLWDIRNPNTLYTTLKRYVQSGLLFRIRKGMYSIISLEKLDPILIGIKTIHSYAYISTETVLFTKGIINQRPGSITIVSAHSIKFEVLFNNYISRQLNDRFLFNPAGIIKESKILTASVERAVADLLYFNPKTYFDSPEQIDWYKVTEIQKCLGYKELRRGRSK